MGMGQGQHHVDQPLCRMQRADLARRADMNESGYYFSAGPRLTIRIHDRPQCLIPARLQGINIKEDFYRRNGDYGGERPAQCHICGGAIR